MCMSAMEVLQLWAEPMVLRDGTAKQEGLLQAAFRNRWYYAKGLLCLGWWSLIRDRPPQRLRMIAEHKDRATFGGLG